MAHNKTLAAQLYAEFKEFFPNNAVEYFVSYYDYYQPEAYIPSSGVFIEKDLSINDDIERLRISTSSALLSGRRDVLVIASVSCLYGIGNPVEFKKNVITIEQDQVLARTKFLHMLVQSLYSRTETEIKSGSIKVKGDTITIYTSYGEFAYRVHSFGDEIEEIESFDADELLFLFGLNKKLGPILEWDIELNSKKIKVNTENFETTKKGIFAVGDINDYPGKLDLILSGFHETTLAVQEAYKRINPGERVPFGYTTSNSKLQKKLGVLED